MILIGSSTIFAKHLSHEVILTKQESFRAELKTNVQFHSIALPPHTTLESILVNPGDRVFRGQTIAEIDTEETSRLISIVESELYAVRVERRCILNPEGFQDSDISLENDFHLNRATHNCLSALTHFDNRETTLLAQKSSLLRQRNAILQQALRWGALSHLQDGNNLEPVEIRNLAELQLEIIDTEILMSEIEQDIIVVDRERRSEISAKIEELTLSIHSTELILEQLKHFKRHPKITADEGGTIVQLRNPAAGHQNRDQPIFVDIDTDNGRANLELRLQDSPHAGFSIGSPVVVSFLSAQSGQILYYSGYISSVDETERNRGFIEAKISLSNESPNWPRQYLRESAEIELVTNPRPDNLGSAIDRNLTISIKS